MQHDRATLHGGRIHRTNLELRFYCNRSQNITPILHRGDKSTVARGYESTEETRVISEAHERCRQAIQPVKVRRPCRVIVAIHLHVSSTTAAAAAKHYSSCLEERKCPVLARRIYIRNLIPKVKCSKHSKHSENKNKIYNIKYKNSIKIIAHSIKSVTTTEGNQDNLNPPQTLHTLHIHTQ